jgi:hypothetical protein
MTKNRIIGLIALFISILMGILWISHQSLLTQYINGKVPGVQVDNARVISWDCASLEEVRVTLPKVTGKFTKAIVCRSAKTVDINGGTLKVSLESQSVKDVTTSKGYRIQAQNLTLEVSKGEMLGTLERATIDPLRVCGTHARVRHPRAEVTIQGLCFDRLTKISQWEAGTLKSKEGEVTFESGTSSLEIGANISKASIKRGNSEIELVGVILTRLPGDRIKVKSDKVSVVDPRLYPEPVSLQKVESSDLDLKALKTSDNWVMVNGAKVNFNLESQHVWGNEPCSKWLESTPKELKGAPIDQVRLKGDFRFDVQLKPDVKLSMRNGCKLEGDIPPFLKELSRKFTYTAYHPKGRGSFQRTSGPGSAEWVPIRLVSPNMATALTTTEDPGFFKHQGFIPEAIENSLRDNIKLGKFFRGGSTLTMQLAKNLWLTRTRSVGRKVQEALLTLALESALSKEHILELYLNVVEFGPDLYGIGPASDQLIHKNPISLSLAESLYLTLRLPAPNNQAPYSQKKGLMLQLLDGMAATGKVPEPLIAVEKSMLEDLDLP